MAYPHLLIKIPQFLVDELSAVIGDDGVRQAEARNNVPPNKRVDLSSDDVGQGFCFDPFSEIIYDDQYELLLRSTERKWTDDVHTPLCEWPWGC